MNLARRVGIKLLKFSLLLAIGFGTVKVLSATKHWISSDKQSENSQNGGPRLLCLIPVHYEGKGFVPIEDTWGRRCDKLVFFDTIDANSTININIPFSKHTVLLNVTEGRRNLWLKIRSGFEYVFNNHLEDADWFLKADDDTFVVVDNLKHILQQFDPDDAVYFGRKLWDEDKFDVGYISGGSGYTLSRGALRNLGETQMRSPSLDSRCNWRDEKLDIRPEDVNMGICLKELGIYPTSPANTTRTSELIWRAKAAQDKSGRSDHLDQWFDNIQEKFRTNFLCCNGVPLSFHSVRGSDMYLIEYFLSNMTRTFAES